MAEENQNLDALRSFVEARQLSNFFTTDSNDSGYLADVSSKAAEYMKKYQEGSGTQNMLFANPEIAFNVVKLSLYNHVLYCDDSGSMSGHPMVALKKTAKHVATIANALKETSNHVGGLSIRFINYSGDSHMNNIGTVAGVEQALSNVYASGATEIGTQLRRKVLQPFIVDVLERPGGKLDKPFLITIITDGEPAGESRDTLKNTVLWCKQYMEQKGYGPWAVGFHIVQIGDCWGARAFLQEIEEDAEVRDHVYISAESIGDGRIGGKSQQTAPQQNELWWVDSLLKGIEH